MHRLLQEQIKVLKQMRASRLLISHKEPIVQEKQTVLEYLEEIYAGISDGYE